MAPHNDLAARKRAIDDGRRAERNKKRRARRERHMCFWTWPWGHRWEIVKSGYGYDIVECAGCAQRKDRWYM